MNIFSVLFLIWFALFSVGFAQTATDQTSDILQEKQQKLESFCKKMNVRFKAFGWGKIICNSKRWTYDSLSVNGDPLIYQSFMNAGPGKPVTLILCTVHGDEYTSPYLCIRLVRDIIFDNPDKYKNVNVVVAPLIDPDGFLLKKPSRLNGRGVDLNRNFPTRNWDQEALQSWAKNYKKDPRRFPGHKAASEPETLFQMDLIEKYKPEKIMAIHAPYGFLDYDISSKQSASLNSEVRDLAITISKESKNFRVVDFHVFPGSLGNYAGLEKGIPTYTLELSASSSQWGEAYWDRFKSSFLKVMQYNFKNNVANKTPTAVEQIIKN